jgi:pimeloyl-ACP methyl ester carboxylesterase
MIEVNGIELALDARGDGPAVVLLHGFPELAYSWRHQIPALADAGYRVVSFDQRGYGASAKPEGIDQYRLELLVDDVVGVLDALGIESATVVGHDWGSIVAYSTAITRPERVDRVVSLNVPYRGACWGFPSMDVIRSQLADRFPYVIMFQEDGVAEAGFDANPEMWLQGFYRGGSRGRQFLTPDEFQVYLDAFTSGGVSGPVNWYRNIDANAAEFSSHMDAPMTQPMLMIAADSDPVLPLAMTEGMDRWVPDIDMVVVEDCTHWTQQEHPVEVNAALLNWLGK